MLPKEHTSCHVCPHCGKSLINVSLLTYADLTLDLFTRQAKRQDKDIYLTVREFELLELLIRNPDKPLSRSYLSECIWRTDSSPSSNVIDVYISFLRKKIDKPFPNDPNLLRTVPGGYILSENLE